MIRRRSLLALALAAPFAAPVRAEAPAGGPTTPVAALNDGLLAVMHAGKDGVKFDQRLRMLQPVVERSFDLPLILQNSVGPRWTAFSADMKSQLLDVFTRFTVATWVANFDTFDGERFVILPELRRVGADEVVQTRLTPTSGDPTRLDYVTRRVGDRWRVIDILLDGSISRVAVQRSDFRALLRGGDIAPLVASLREKIAGLAAGNGN